MRRERGGVFTGRCRNEQKGAELHSKIRPLRLRFSGYMLHKHICAATGFTMRGQPVWTKSHQPHRHSWLRPLSVMEGKWSDGWLLAAPSQMAAGTALRLADNQRTSKLRRALKPISVQSQEAKGTDQRKETAIDKDWGSQKSQQAWK